VLLVEDNPAEVRLVEEAFRQSADPLDFHTVSDGEEALDFVYRRYRDAEKPRPDLILLDINLPKIDGHQVLREIKNEPDLRRIPVLMLAGSGSHNDVQSAYDNHANAYLRKPNDLNDYFEMVAEVKRLWLQVAVSAPRLCKLHP